jgi:hypothetical protein
MSFGDPKWRIVMYGDYSIVYNLVFDVGNLVATTCNFIKMVHNLAANGARRLDTYEL